MKLNFSLKNKDASIEADIEKLIDKSILSKSERAKIKATKKTWYQIRQEEKRKNKELEFKQRMQTVIIGSVFLILIIILCFVML